MDVQTKLMLLCMAALAFVLVIGVLRVIGAWYDHHVSRHDLIAESKQRRYDYLKAKHDRDRELEALQEQVAAESIIIEDDEPMLAQAA